MANVFGTNGDDNSAIFPGNPSVNGTAAGDNLYGWASSSTASDDIGNDFLNGFGGIDFIYGGGGDDVIDGGSDADFMAGGTGNDHYDVDDSGDVIIEAVGDGEADSATVYGVDYTLADNVYIEDLAGDQAVDRGVGQLLAGNNLDNQIEIFVSKYSNTMDGNGGNDYLIGPRAMFGEPAPFTLMMGGDGNDILEARDGDAYMMGEAGQDHLWQPTGHADMLGGGGNDVYHVFHGDLTMTENAGEGRDKVIVYGIADWTLAANVEDIAAHAATTNGHNFVGNDRNNAMTGSRFADGFDGGLGNDTIKGLGGRDLIIGGQGRDTLTGNAGNDRFQFNLVSESGPDLASRDQITDFTSGDKIDVFGIDADQTGGGNEAFVLDTGGGFTVGEIRQRVTADGLLLTFNVDADADAEMSILLAGVSAALGDTDFRL